MKEIIVKLWKRVVRAFDGTKECHAKLDAAVHRAESVVRKAEKSLPPQEFAKNGTH